nr:PREDICTED: uncharacterized protein LOC107399103 isoform X2 [Tribolium castaneum]|eukprot:XP_015840270.1 PREDICTED: uncharacterized protein LOC107399103 isoform X2 [Tribolium castaneum]
MGPKSKIAAYNSLIYRLFRIPLSPESFDREWNIIKQIAVAPESICYARTDFHPVNPLPPPYPLRLSSTTRDS